MSSGRRRSAYAWAQGMPDQYMTNTILRLRPRAGSKASPARRCSYRLWLRPRRGGEPCGRCCPTLIGASPADREAIWHRMFNLTLPDLPQAHSAIDIALWDLAAKAAGLPLYQLLGGARDKILSYASTPLLAESTRPISISSPA